MNFVLTKEQETLEKGLTILLKSTDMHTVRAKFPSHRYLQTRIN